jgi:alkylation response protein AidB-like acyl-CoA dehydrogenase
VPDELPPLRSLDTLPNNLPAQATPLIGREAQTEAGRGRLLRSDVRQLRRELDRADFDRLREAGFLLAVVPPEHGGVWRGPAASARPLCEIVRALGRADSSVALVAAMHPVVLYTLGWSADLEPPARCREDWEAQRRWVLATVREGAWWGTISSEPGSGGDLQRTRAAARPDRSAGPGRYRLTGQKHFGSGAGISSFMVTAARPLGELEPDFFILDLRAAPWDGSAGLRLTAAWDGHGMVASQSHAFALEEFPAARLAWPWDGRGPGAFDLLECCCAAVVVGVVDVARQTARQHVAARAASLRAYERVEWTRAEVEGWLVEQAYEAMLRSVEGGDSRSVLTAKTAIAELAESALGRICRVVGGGTYSRGSPFGHWLEDVRALGFLRPGWGLAYDSLLDASLAAPT